MRRMLTDDELAQVAGGNKPPFTPVLPEHLGAEIIHYYCPEGYYLFLLHKGEHYSMNTYPCTTCNQVYSIDQCIAVEAD